MNMSIDKEWYKLSDLVTVRLRGRSPAPFVRIDRREILSCGLLVKNVRPEDSQHT